MLQSDFDVDSNAVIRDLNNIIVVSIQKTEVTSFEGMEAGFR
jgi:hypothetical protein